LFHFPRRFIIDSQVESTFVQGISAMNPIRSRTILVILFVLVLMSRVAATQLDDSLRQAVQAGNETLAMQLLAQGADVLAVNAQGKTILDEAIEHDASFALIDSFIKAKATGLQRLALSVPLARLYSDDIDLLLANATASRLATDQTTGLLQEAIIRASLYRLAMPKAIPSDVLRVAIDDSNGPMWPPSFDVELSGAPFGSTKWKVHSEGTLASLQAGGFPTLSESSIAVQGTWSIVPSAEQDSFDIVIDTVSVLNTETNRLLATLRARQVVSRFRAPDWRNAKGVPPRQVSATVQAVAAGAYHSLILKDDATVLASGSNANGQLGLSIKEDVFSVTALPYSFASVMAAGRYSMALDGNHAVWVWGDNSYGQLATGSTQPVPYPVKVIEGIASLGTGWYHSMMVDQAGVLWASGNNRNGQLGDRSATDRLEPVRVKEAVASVACGGYHSLVIDTDGSLWATGNNLHGQLGDGSTVPQIKFIKVADGAKAIAAGAFHTLYIDADSRLWAAGANEAGQLGIGTLQDSSTFTAVAEKVVSVSAGRNFTIFITSDGNLYHMGDNRFGQAGSGQGQANLSPVLVMGDVAAASAGWYHVVVLTKAGEVVTIGYNGNGQLGAGLPEWETGPLTILP
jgi:alpha-tubulin suppressor-like RCC1 family protein